MNKLKVLFMSLFLIWLAVPVYAGTNGQLTKEETYTTTDENGQLEFDSVILENGKKYVLDRVDYELLSKEKIEKEVEVSETVVSDPVDESYLPEGTLEKDGVVYQLEDYDYEEIQLSEGSTQVVKEEVTSEEIPPQEKVVEEWDVVKNEYVEVAVSRRSIQEQEQWVPVSFPIHFQEYDADTYVFGDKYYPRNETSPAMSGNDVLEYLGLSKEDYQITSITYDGSAYQDEQGVWYRDATAYGQERHVIYNASYEGTIYHDSSYDRIYTSVYKGQQKIDTGMHSYTYKATAFYQEEKSNTPLIVTMSIAILLLLVAVVGVLYLLAKKKRDKKN